MIEYYRDIERARRYPHVDFNADPPVWHVVCHGGGDPDMDFELSVVRSDHKHAFISWGWEDERKLVIASKVSGACKRLPGLFQLYMQIAERAAEWLNNPATEPLLNSPISNTTGGN